MRPPAQATSQGSVLSGGVRTVEGAGMDGGKTSQVHLFPLIKAAAAFDYLEFCPIWCRACARPSLAFKQICVTLREKAVPLINLNCESSVSVSRCVSSCKVLFVSL